MHPTDKAARIAGAVYLSMVLTGPFSFIYAPSKLIVRGNATATANILSSVSKPWAVAMLGFVLVSAAVGFLNTLNNVAAFMLFRGADFLNVFEQAQRNALGMFFLRLHSQGNFINEVFWGLWLFPFGLLVFRSGFLPRTIGVWLMINCVAWLVLSPIALFAPSYYDSAFRFAQPLLFGELAIMLWLLIKGAKVTSLAPTTVQMKTA